VFNNGHISKKKINNYIETHDTNCIRVLQLNSTTEIQINQKTNLNCLISWKINPQQPQFRETLLSALDITFYRLGCKQEIYHRLEAEYGLNKQEIHQNIPTFVIAIETIFGEAATLLEINIMNHLHSQVNGFHYYAYVQDWTFIKYLVSLKGFLSTN
jgi:hypothetical protein